MYNPNANAPFQSSSNYTGLGNLGNQVGSTNIQQQSATSGKKKVFGLNVSEEFTNSWTIKKMAEPFKSNVVNIKSRARQFRTSLSGYLK